MCHEVFEGGDVKYAYTTIPTYPRRVSLASSLILTLRQPVLCAEKPEWNEALFLSAFELKVKVEEPLMLHNLFVAFNTLLWSSPSQ